MPGPIHEVSFRAGPGTWHLLRAQPASDLAADILELWEVRGELAPFRETLLPNGCTEVMVNLGPSHRIPEGPGKGTWDTAWFSGLQEHALTIESDNGTHLVSARLRPLGAARLLGEGVARHANTVVDLEVVAGARAAELRRALLGAASAIDRFALLEEFLRAAAPEGAEPPAFVWEAARRIEEAHGLVRVSELHVSSGVSRKHLSVMFARWVGVPAKAYARIQRFVWTLGRLQSGEDVDWPRVASEAGYLDQSHLGRDFQRVGAASPLEYVRRATPDGAALWDEGR